MASPQLSEDSLDLSEAEQQAELAEETEVSWSIRRILVALDASSNSRVALAAAIGLAETFKSEVEGLFIEDINLLRLAELPFAREIRFAETRLQQLEQEGIHRKLRARAALLKRELEEMATEHNVTSSFRVIRGSVSQALLAAALESDLLALGRIGQTILRQSHLGSTARTVVEQASSVVLLTTPEMAIGPIIALYDGSMTGNRLLHLSATLAERSGDLRVLVWAATDDEAFDRRQQAAEILDPLHVQAQYQHLSGDNPQLVLEWVNRQKGSLLVLGKSDALPPDIFQTLLDEAGQHILVIR